MSDEGAGTRPPRGGGAGAAPATVRAAVGLLFAESAVVVGALGYAGLTEGVDDWRNALIVTGFAVVVAGVLGLLGWSLRRRRAWARGPAIVMETMLLPIGWYMVAAGQGWFGVPVFVLGLVGTGLLAAPATRQALEAR